MGIDQAIASLLDYGALGAAVVILLVFLIRKDRQVNALYVRLVEKAERDSAKYHELAAAQGEVLKELVEEIQELQDDNKR